MKESIALSFILSTLMIGASCDMRSDTAKEEMEKFSRTRTPDPVISPTPTPPIDPADAVRVDTGLEGETIGVNGIYEKQTLICSKYNRVMINADKSTITIKGICRQIMINGDGNRISVDAATEFVMNGSENDVTYAQYPNGNPPVIVENMQGNIIHAAKGKTTK